MLSCSELGPSCQLRCPRTLWVPVRADGEPRLNEALRQRRLGERRRLLPRANSGRGCKQHQPGCKQQRPGDEQQRRGLFLHGRRHDGWTELVEGHRAAGEHAPPTPATHATPLRPRPRAIPPPFRRDAP